MTSPEPSGEPAPDSKPGVPAPGSGSASRSASASPSGSAPSSASAPPSGSAPSSASAPPSESGEAAPRSGLRNPEAAVRGLGAGTLVLEAIVLLLAIQPIRIMGGELSGWGVGSVIALAVVAVLLAGMMRRPWAWTAGTGLQALLLASGLFHWSLAALGLIFGGAWVYALYVRRTILG